MNNDTPRIVVHAFPGVQAQKIASAVNSLIGSDVTAKGFAESSYAAHQRLSADPELKLCVFYEDPIQSICAAMSARVDIPASLVEWANAARDVLVLHRRHRKRSMIFQIDHLQRYAAAGLARMGIEGDSQTLSDTQNSTIPLSPLQRILAQAILAEDQEAQLLYDELVASSQILSNEDAPPQTEFALKAYAELGVELDAREALKTQASDLEALRKIQISSEQDKAEIQAKLDAMTQRSARLAALQESMLSDMMKLGQQIEAGNKLSNDLEIQLKAEEETKERIILERDQREMELKTIEKTLEQTLSALSNRDEELIMAQKEIDRILRSRSMRLTQSLRKMANLLRGRR